LIQPPKEQYGLFFFNEIPSANVDIIAVHGLGGYLEKTRTDENSQLLWLRDFLPSQLADAGKYFHSSRSVFFMIITGQIPSRICPLSSTAGGLSE